MKAFYCTACGHGLVFGSRDRESCPASAEEGGAPTQASPAGPSKLARLSAFFASQASLSLITLLVFLGLGVALAPAGWSYARMQLPARAAATPTSAAHGFGATPPMACVRCNSLVVFFADTATLGEIADLLKVLEASIAAGPDQNGAYELAVPEESAVAVAQALNEAEYTVTGVFIKPRCAGS
jgi:hypothetical protein